MVSTPFWYVTRFTKLSFQVSSTPFDVLDDFDDLDELDDLDVVIIISI